eukprot:scaffold109039_cov22-Tisochrysis_lutea.AAC.2
MRTLPTSIKEEESHWLKLCADLPRLRVESELVESDDPFAAVDTPNDVAAANKLCSVCMDSERNCRLRPCMHAALCTECAQGARVVGWGGRCYHLIELGAPNRKG